jgi:hypothetical protein
MSKEKDAAWREMMSKRADESREDTFDSWIVDLTDKEDQPESCGIDDDDCEACGS